MVRFALIFGLAFVLVFSLVACGAGTAYDIEADAESPDSAEDGADLPRAVELLFFYDEACATCIGAKEFFLLVDEQLGGSAGEQYPFSINTINVFHRGARDRFIDVSYNLLGMDAREIQLPALIIGDRVYQGMGAIEANLLEAYLAAGHDLFANGG